ncbi:MAG: hypothetical protein R2838_04430 [Caldilineaceae bacterium]
MAEPAGTVSFAYTGRELALQLAPGAYWGYLFVTVDGAPANALPAITGNVDSRGAPAGYTTLYAPEDHRRRPLGRGTAQRCGPAADGSPHQARVEIWRSWGQTPLRAVAIDALPPAAPPAWPGVLLLVSGLLCVLAAWTWRPMSQAVRPTVLAQLANVADAKYAGDWAPAGPGRRRIDRARCAPGPLVADVGGRGLAGAGRAAAPRALAQAFVVALPFYFGVTLPLLPQRNFSIIDLGVLGGVGLLVVHGLLFPRPQARRPAPVEIAAVVLAGWALVTAPRPRTRTWPATSGAPSSSTARSSW